MGKPLSFLCQIDLAAIATTAQPSPLPWTGFLHFFYDAVEQPWGFDPKDRGCCRVLYSETMENPADLLLPASLSDHGSFTEVAVALQNVLTYPDSQDPRVGDVPLSDADGDAYIELCSGVFAGKPAHHLLGHSAPVQGNDMDLECQLVTHGVYCGDASGYNSAAAKTLEKGRADWRLLLQLDSDDDAGMMWGDLGRLYFWITKQDLARRDFSNVWVILQCS